MSRIAVVVDSAAGVDPAYAAAHDVRVYPLLIQMQGQTLRDGIDITTEDFYHELPHCSPPPTTSQTPVGDLVALYSSLKDEGYEGIISAHLSSGMSSAFSVAQTIAPTIGIPVEEVDTLCAASGSLFCVEAAVRAVEGGASLAEAAAAARHVADTQCTIFAVETLEYLHRSGRISAPVALVGSVLQFKPLLHFEDGRMEVFEKVRTSRRAVHRVAEVVAEQVGVDTPVLARVVHAAAPEQAQELVELAQETLNIVEMRVGNVPAVLGTHTGPGVFSLCCCPVADANL